MKKILILTSNPRNDLIYGLIGALIGVLKSGYRSTEVKQRTFSNQGIWDSSKNSFRMGLIYGLIGAVIRALIPVSEWLDGLIYGLLFGLAFGLIVGLLNGGATCIQHFNLRRILYRQGRIPWNYSRFLDYASERLLMKKVGGGYIFYHRMLMEHFAQRHQVSREPDPLTPRQTFQPIPQANTRTKVRSSNINHPMPQPSKPIHNYIVCNNCARRNPTNGKFCTNCGSQLISI